MDRSGSASQNGGHRILRVNDTYAGAHQVFVTAYEDQPNVIEVYVTELVVAAIEETVIGPVPRLGIGDEILDVSYDCGPGHYATALETERSFMVRDDLSGSEHFPPVLRWYATHALTMALNK